MSEEKAVGQVARFIFLHLSSDEVELIAKKPPAISALQSLETTLLLFGLRRFPQALVTLASAIQSAAASIEGRDSKVEIHLGEDLRSLDREGYKVFKRPPVPTLTAFRESRNRIAHFGFSTRDDEECARLCLCVGIPLLIGWMRARHEIDLLARMDDLGPLLSISTELMQKSNESEAISALHATRGVSRWIMYRTRHSFLARWEAEVLYSNEETFGTNTESGFDLKMARLDVLKKNDPYVILECPICCESSVFVVGLNQEIFFEEKKLRAETAACANCDVSFPDGSAPLLDALCKDQFTQALIDETFKDYRVQ